MAMSADGAVIKTRTEFFCLSKYEGEHSSVPVTGDELRDRLNSLQADLTDPQCLEIIAGGEGRPTCIWRKV